MRGGSARIWARSSCWTSSFPATSREGGPGDASRASRAADNDGAVVKEAEHDKHTRYPAAQAPYKLVPLAVDTYGCLGCEALQHFRLGSMWGSLPQSLLNNELPLLLYMWHDHCHAA